MMVEGDMLFAAISLLQKKRRAIDVLLLSPPKRSKDVLDDWVLEDRGYLMFHEQHGTLIKEGEMLVAAGLVHCVWWWNAALRRLV
jgi:hypothetical protein